MIHEYNSVITRARKTIIYFYCIDSVKIIDVDIDIPKYDMEIRALRPKNPTLNTFSSKPILAELDSLLELFCKIRIVEREVKSDIECATVPYNKKAKLRYI